MPEQASPVRHYTRWPQVEGYCGQLSHEAGDRVEVHCASRAERFSVEVTRIGAERTPMWSQHGVRGVDHEVPDRAWEKGCDWPVSFTVPTERTWPSGYYEVRLIDRTTGGFTATSEAFFVLRTPTAAAPSSGTTARSDRPLLVLATNTYNAYNQWGGRCLYSGATKVSFARPMERGLLYRPAAPFEIDFDGRIANVATPSDPEHRRLLEYQAANSYPLWCDSTGWHNWERRFARWAEAQGIELDYAVNADLADRPQVLDGRRLMLSVGHDEYWSWEMRDTVESWVDQGGNWAILSGNTCNWQVRYEDDGRTMVCYKGSARVDDPMASGSDQRRMTSAWCDPLIGRPETSTIGLSFSRGGYHRVGQAMPDGAGAYEIHRPEHWAFAETGLTEGALVGHASFAVGYEVDGCAFTTIDGRPVPTGEDGAPSDLEILATAPARLMSITDDECMAPAGLWASLDPPGDLQEAASILFGDAGPENVAKLAEGHAVMGAFTRGRGTVFNAGSADWSYGLDDDPLVQQITANVITHLTAGP